MAGANTPSRASTKPGWGRKLLFLAVGYPSAALAVAFAWVAIRSGTSPTDSWFGIIIGWTIVVLLLIGGLGVAVYATRVLVDRDPWVELTDDEARVVRAGAVLRRLPVEEVTRIMVLPGRRSTVTGARGEADPMASGSRQRLNSDILIHDGTGEPVCVSEGPGWAESVTILRRWVRARPDLAQDEPSKEFFAR